MESKHYLASSNSGDGFINYFDNINTNDNNSFRYVIKGGPGSGKSTLMKKIGNYFALAGEKIEYYHCSSDSDSLDGVRLVNKNICVVDGTSPHALEANLPSITDKIVDVGSCILDGVRQNMEEVKKLVNLKQSCYDQLYRYLKAVKHILEIDTVICKKYIDLARVDKNSEKLVINITKNNKENGKNKIRHLFISFIEDGGMNDFEKANNYKKTIILQSNVYENSECIKNFITKSEDNNLDLIILHDNINTENIWGVVIENKGILIKNKNYNSDFLAHDKIKLTSNKKLLRMILNSASNELSNAKKYHKQIEKLYINYIDFSSLNKITENLIKEIENKNNVI